MTSSASGKPLSFFLQLNVYLVWNFFNVKSSFFHSKLIILTMHGLLLDSARHVPQHLSQHPKYGTVKLTWFITHQELRVSFIRDGKTFKTAKLISGIVIKYAHVLSSEYINDCRCQFYKYFPSSYSLFVTTL